MEDNDYELLSSEPDQLPTYSVVPEDKIFQFKVVRGEMENKFKLKLKAGQTLPHTSNAKCKGIVNKLISSGPALAKNTSLCPSTATSAGELHQLVTRYWPLVTGSPTALRCRHARGLYRLTLSCVASFYLPPLQNQNNTFLKTVVAEKVITFLYSFSLLLGCERIVYAILVWPFRFIHTDFPFAIICTEKLMLFQCRNSPKIGEAGRGGVLEFDFIQFAKL